MTTTLTMSQINARIEEIEATPRALIGSDEGTHGTPANYRLYEEITGERYAVRHFGGTNGVRCEIKEAEDRTAGRVRIFPVSQKEIRDLQNELRELRKLAREAK